jgi:hypothetical protein
MEFEDICGWITLKYKDSTFCVGVYLAQDSVMMMMIIVIIIGIKSEIMKREHAC